MTVGNDIRPRYYIYWVVCWTAWPLAIQLLLIVENGTIMRKRLTGLIAATFTPMHADGTLNLDAVTPLVDHLFREGIAGLYVVGSTGEGVSLSGHERRATAEAFVWASAGRLPVVVQVGHNSLAEARQLATHAQQIGATAISATPPHYFKIDSAETLVACMSEVARGAPAMPFYYYHVPHLTGVGINMLDFLRIAGQRLPTLAGIKYTAPTVYEMQACMEFADRRFDILHGVDEMLLAGLTIGLGGAVGSTYNFAAPVYRRVIQAFSDGDLDEARLWQARSFDMVRVIVRHCGLAGQKAVMKLIGLDCGPTRLPIPGLTENEQSELRDELTAIGFFDWIRPTESPDGNGQSYSMQWLPHSRRPAHDRVPSR